MSIKSAIRCGLRLLIAVILTSIMATAQESGSPSSLGTFIGQVINFLILFGGLAYLLKKPVVDYLKHKSEQIAELIRKSEEFKNASARKLAEIERRASHLDEEINRMKAEAAEEALKEKERIKMEAQQEAARLKKLAAEEIDSMVRASLQELKAYTIELSVALTEEKIRQKLGPELHRKMIKKAINDLKAFYESSIAN
ncbi:MAG: hypothetical protein ACPLZD_04930 [Candidatus Saccharicenans sp.]